MIGTSLLNSTARDGFLAIDTAYGWVDTMALSASYNFTSSEFAAGSRNLRPGEPLPEVQKTVLHETTHLYQLLATTYGMYSYSLRQLQSDLVRWILTLLPQKYGISVRLPLADLCATLRPPERYAEIGQLLAHWLAAELVFHHLEGAFDKTAALARRFPMIQSWSVSRCFQVVDLLMARFFQSTGRPCPAVSGPADLVQEDVLYELLHVGLKAMGYPDVGGILETWAKAAEHWGERDRPLADCPKFFPAILQPELVSYYVPLWRIRDKLATDSVNEFILSYMAVCEVAMSPPILPTLQPLRPAAFRLRDMSPTARMERIREALNEVSPIRRLEADYEQFVQTICDRLGWPTPTRIAEATVDNFTFQQGDRLSETYYHAQRFRIRIPYIFIDPGVWFSPSREYTREFAYYFTHPVIEFTDCTLHHPDPHFVAFFTMQRLMNLYFRTLLTGRGQTVTMPYWASEAELSAYAGLMEQTLEATAGIRLRVHLVNPV